MIFNKCSLIFLVLFFSYLIHSSNARAIVSLEDKMVVKTETIEDFEDKIRELNIEKDPKKVIKLKYGVPEILRKNNSVISLDKPFCIVIDPPLSGELEVFYNSSRSKI